MKLIPQAHRRAGFSLLEIIIAVSILAILAGVMTMRSGSMLEKSRATQVVSTIDAVKSAAVLYQTDTGLLAREYAGYAANQRHLSGTQTTAGWSGPYLDAPFSTTGNPWGGLTHLYNSTTAGGHAGFDTDADGTIDVAGPGNMLYMNRVTEEAAQRIDDTIDKGIGSDWATGGRVMFSNGILRVLIHY